MNAETARELSVDIAYWMFQQSSDIISDPDTFAEALEKYLIEQQ